jgi:hypothetical protein
VRVALRRWWVVCGALLAAVIVAGVIWAHGVSKGSAQSRDRFFGTEVTTTTRSQNWCVPISRQAALAAVERWLAQSSFRPAPPADSSLSGASLSASEWTLEAKLIRWSEWSTLPEPDRADPSRWWLIEMRVDPPHLVAGKRVSWLLAWVNARTGTVRAESEGTGTPTARWTAVSDHSRLCSSMTLHP